MPCAFATPDISLLFSTGSAFAHELSQLHGISQPPRAVHGFSGAFHTPNNLVTCLGVGDRSAISVGEQNTTQQHVMSNKSEWGDPKVTSVVSLHASVFLYLSKGKNPKPKHYSEPPSQ